MSRRSTFLVALTVALVGLAVGIGVDAVDAVDGRFISSANGPDQPPWQGHPDLAPA